MLSSRFVELLHPLPVRLKVSHALVSWTIYTWNERKKITYGYFITNKQSPTVTIKTLSHWQAVPIRLLLRWRTNKTTVSHWRSWEFSQLAPPTEKGKWHICIAFDLQRRKRIWIKNIPMCRLFCISPPTSIHGAELCLSNQWDDGIPSVPKENSFEQPIGESSRVSWVEKS